MADIQEWFLDLRSRCQRFRRGWADVDAECIPFWLADVLPQMLEKLAEDACGSMIGCCGSWVDGMEPEEWHELLYRMANDLRLATGKGIWRIALRDENGNIDCEDAARIARTHKDRFLRDFAMYFCDLSGDLGFAKCDRKNKKDAHI